MQLNKRLVGQMIFAAALPLSFFVAWLVFGYETQIPTFIFTLFSGIFVAGQCSAGELHRKKIGEVRIEEGKKHSFNIEGPFDFERVRVTIRNRDFPVGFRDYFKKALDVVVLVKAGKQQLDETKLSFIYHDKRQTILAEVWMGKIDWYFPMNRNYMKYRNTLTISVESLRHRVDVEVWASRTWSEENRARRKRDSNNGAR